MKNRNLVKIINMLIIIIIIIMHFSSVYATQAISTGSGGDGGIRID